MTTNDIAANAAAYKARAAEHGLPVHERRWLTWRPGAVNKAGKRQKVPYAPGTRCSRKARTDDPATWGTLDQALADCAAVPADDAERRPGVGLALGQGWLCLDLDSCLVGGKAAAWARPWLEAATAAGWYVERSPSGNGLKMIARDGAWIRGGILWTGSSKRENVQLIGAAHAGYTTVTLWQARGVVQACDALGPVEAVIAEHEALRRQHEDAREVLQPDMEPFEYTVAIEQALEVIREEAKDDWSAAVLRGMRRIGEKTGFSDGQLFALCWNEFQDKALEHAFGDGARAEYWLWKYGLGGHKGGPMLGRARGDGVELLEIAGDSAADPDGGGGVYRRLPGDVAGESYAPDGSLIPDEAYELDTGKPDIVDTFGRVRVVYDSNDPEIGIRRTLHAMATVPRNSRFAVYKRGMEPVVIRRIKKRLLTGGVVVPEGNQLIIPLTPLMCGAFAAKAVEIGKLVKAKDDDEKKWKKAPLPANFGNLIQQFFAMQAVAPELTGVMDHAVINVAGRLITQPGYDAATGVYLTEDVLPFERMSAEAALATLKEPFEEFPFAEDHHRSAAIAGMMTAVLRPIMQVAPLFLVEAPIQQSGKTLLSRVLSLAGCGAEPATLIWPNGRDSETDMKKLLLSVLRVNPRVVVFDNAEGRLYSAAVASMITSGTFSDRVLGESTTLQLPANSLFIVNGNNVTLDRDMQSRAIVIRIEPRSEDPGSSRFKRRLVPFVQENRVRLINAVISLSLAYKDAGWPLIEGARHRDRFDVWERMVAKPLVWAGMADPQGGLAEVASGEAEERVAFGDFLRWALDKYGTNSFSAKDIIDVLNGDMGEDTVLKACMATFDIYGGMGNDVKKLGDRLSRERGVPHRGLRLINKLTRLGFRWKVQKL